MQRSELAHVLRASSAIAHETSFVLIGVQAAGSQKDADYVRVLLQHKLVNLDVLIERIGLLDAAKNNLTHITQWTQRRAQEATA